MRKLLNLKKFLSIEDAAKKLTLSFSEDVAIADVIQLIVDEQLPVSVHLQHQYAEQIAPYTTLIGFWPLPDDPLTAVLRQVDANHKSLLDDDTPMAIPSFRILTKRPEGRLPKKLDGVFEIDLELSPHVKDHLRSMLTGGDGDLAGMEGIFVRDDEESLWRLLDSTWIEEVDNAYLKNSCDDISNNKGSMLKRYARGYWSFYPGGELPKPSQLAIKPSDIIAFESTILDDNQKPKNTSGKPSNSDEFSTKERTTLYKIILGMAKTKYNYTPGGRNSCTGNNKGSIAADLQEQGYQVDADTIREHLKKAYEEVG